MIKMFRNVVFPHGKVTALLASPYCKSLSFMKHILENLESNIF